MKPSKVLTSRGEWMFEKIFKEVRGEDRRILLSKYKLQKVGKRLLKLDERHKAQAHALWEVIESGNDEAADEVLRAWLRDCRPELLSTFLNHFGIANQRGITEEDTWKEKIAKGDIDGAVAKLKASFNREEAWIYLHFLDIPEVEASPALSTLLTG